MKKVKIFALLTLIFFSITSAMGQSKVEHLKFSGIPIDGTITSFQSKLTAKGFQLNKTESSRLSNGIRLFSGTFIGNKASIYTYYDESTKIVYRVKVVIGDLTEKLAEQKYSEIGNLLFQKYENCPYREGTHDDKESISIVPLKSGVSKDNFSDISQALGNIDLFISKDATMLTYPYDYSLHIDYWDQVNTSKHENSVIDEL